MIFCCNTYTVKHLFSANPMIYFFSPKHSIHVHLVSFYVPVPQDSSPFRRIWSDSPRRRTACRCTSSSPGRRCRGTTQSFYTADSSSARPSERRLRNRYRGSARAEPLIRGRKSLLCKRPAWTVDGHDVQFTVLLPSEGALCALCRKIEAVFLNQSHLSPLLPALVFALLCIAVHCCTPISIIHP